MHAHKLRNFGSRASLEIHREIAPAFRCCNSPLTVADGASPPRSARQRHGVGEMTHSMVERGTKWPALSRLLSLRINDDQLFELWDD